MFLAKLEKNQDILLAFPVKDHEVLDYQIKMLNHSDQTNYAQVQLDAQSLYYVITSRLPLELYFKTSCGTYAEIRSLFIQMICGIENCESYLLNSQQLLLDRNYIYYDTNMKDVMYVYQPFVVERQMPLHIDIKNIMLALLYEHVSFETLFKDQRIKDMVTLLQDPVFDLFVFKSYLVTHLKRKKVNKRKWYTSIFNKEKKQPIPEKIINEETIMLELNHRPQLEFDDQLVEINKDVFLIGRSIQLSDLALPKVLSIGRVHAEISKEADSYFIMDINTKNGTYLNGKRIESQKKYTLNTGDIILFSNKKATFK